MDESGLEFTSAADFSQTPLGLGRGRIVREGGDLRRMATELSSMRESLEARSAPKVVVSKPPKVRKFYGDSREDGRYSVKDFIEEIGSAVRDFGREEQIRYVTQHVEGLARVELKSCGQSYSSIEDIFAILVDAFGDKRPLPTLMACFAERRQGSRETVRAYANDLFTRFNAVKAKQEESRRAVSSEDLLVDHFVEGIHDRSLVLDLRRHIQNGSVSFSELRKLALEWEEIRTPVPKNATANTVATHDNSDCFEEVRKMASRQKELEQELEALKVGLSERRPPKYKFTSDGKPICLKCGKPGHVIRSCTWKGLNQ